MRMYKYIV